MNETAYKSEGTLLNVCSLSKHWEMASMKKLFYDEAQSTTQTHYGVTFHMGTLSYILFSLLFFRWSRMTFLLGSLVPSFSLDIVAIGICVPTSIRRAKPVALH